MIPVKTDDTDYNYPEFQPDQLLTADDLNHVFDFLDLENRITRTNLIGIGIVCGLEVSKSASGDTVTITKGTGITSHGYIITHGKEDSTQSISYHKYRTFDALKDQKYDAFVSNNTQKYVLWELIDDDNTISTDNDLNNTFLADKVCLLFYEILEENAKNCDPTSCADKGVKVFVNIRKLLMSSTDANKMCAELNAKANDPVSGDLPVPIKGGLPDIKMPRFETKAANLETANDIFVAYQNVLSSDFVNLVGTALTNAFNQFQKYLNTNTNPFSNFNSKFSFLYDGSISDLQLLHFQYYYDFFSELIMAYNEWKEIAEKLTGMCTPPEALFPRHLIIGEFWTVKPFDYRNYFIPSPILVRYKHNYDKFLALYQRIIRMIVDLTMPVPVKGGNSTIDLNIHITPSTIGNEILGDRAIPYYYDLTNSSNNLLEVWNPDLSENGKENEILRYNPPNTAVDFVLHPLLYNLEPYNFFRIEGHIGKDYAAALATVQNLRDTNRLPFDIVAVAAGSEPGSVDPANFPCYFNDLEILFNSHQAELLCKLCKIIACIYNIPNTLVTEKELTKNELKNVISNLELVNNCKNVLVFNEGTLGGAYEKLHPILVKEYAGLKILDLKDFNDLVNLVIMNKDIKGISEIRKSSETEGNINIIAYFAYLIKLISALADTISTTLANYNYTNMLKVINRILAQVNLATSGQYSGSRRVIYKIPVPG